MTNDECRLRSVIVYMKMAPKNPSKIWRQIFLANANLNGLAIDNNQPRTSSEHFDPPLFQNPHKIILNIAQDFNNQDIIDRPPSIFKVNLFMILCFCTRILCFFRDFSLKFMLFSCLYRWNWARHAMLIPAGGLGAP